VLLDPDSIFKPGPLYSDEDLDVPSEFRSERHNSFDSIEFEFYSPGQSQSKSSDVSTVKPYGGTWSPRNGGGDSKDKRERSVSWKDLEEGAGGGPKKDPEARISPTIPNSPAAGFGNNASGS
jgi:hypothetical protein